MAEDDFFTFYLNSRGFSQLKCREINNCSFPKNDKTNVLIPPPKKEMMKGVIISRDPTTAFFKEYDEASKMNDDAFRKKLLLKGGVLNEKIPVGGIVKRIKKVCEKNNEITFSPDSLSHFLLENCYWTHLLKCYTTSKSEKTIPFSEARQKGYVDTCCKKMLYQELDRILKLPDMEVILLLGADVTKFVYNHLFKDDSENWRESRKYNHCVLIPLPHPSNANGKEWAQPFKSSLLDNIKTLNKICNDK
jgi:hypothetical protein